MEKDKRTLPDVTNEGRDKFFMDIDRMVDGGLGNGRVTDGTGLIEETTTDTMDNEEFTK